MDFKEELLAEKDAAQSIGQKPTTLRNWRALRRGPPNIKIGRKVYYRREALEQWLRSRERDYEAHRINSASKRAQ